jgi:hypothetical protein
MRRALTSIGLILVIGFVFFALALLFRSQGDRTAMAAAPSDAIVNSQSASAPDPCTWTSVPIVNPGAAGTWLYGVSATLATDAWAVGAYYVSGTLHTLVEHWNGSAWSVVSSPNVGTSDNALQAVDAISANNAWGVGYSGAALIEHWDGTSWSVFPTTGFPSGAQLLGIYALSASDIWAVGTTSTSPQHTLAAHFDGSSWTVTPTPDVRTDNILYAVAASSSTDVIAVGYDRATSVPRQTLVEQWNGSTWSVVSSPNVGSLSNSLYGVTTLGPGSYMAVGFSTNQSTNHQTLAISIDSGTATVVPSPNVGTTNNDLYAITPASFGAIAVGQGNNHSLVENWDGSTWTIDCSDDGGTSNGQMNAISRSCQVNCGDSRVSVGIGGNTSAPVPVGWTNNATTGTPTPVPTAPPSPTRTPTPGGPTNTPSPTATEETQDCVWSISPYVIGVPAIHVVAEPPAIIVAAGGSNEAYIAHTNPDGHTLTREALPSPIAGADSSEIKAITSDQQGGLVAVGSYIYGQTYTGDIMRRATFGSPWYIDDSRPDGRLQAVHFSSPNDGWVVGYDSDGIGIVIHYDGNTWTEFDPPFSQPNLELKNVLSFGPNDVYVAGDWNDGTSHPFVAHWDGTTWTEIPVPAPGPAYLDAISHPPDLPAHEFFVGGKTIVGARAEPMVARYNGSTFDSVYMGPSGQGAVLGFAASTQSGDMAVGILTGTTGLVTPLAFKYNGVSFAPTSPNSVGNSSFFSGATVMPEGDIIAVGDFLDNGTLEGLIEEFHCGAPVPPPTLCPISFTDVHTSDYFYTPVNYLYCNTVISGYNASPPCPAGQTPCFLPFNNTTRGQLTKIVTLGFAIPITTPPLGPNLPGTAPSAGYTFADVQPSHTFYQYVETAYANGLVNGYPCGGLGEPCDAQHRPYFRPSNNVTRGQLSKIDAVAAGWPLASPTTGSFEDVLPGSTFYQYVQTAYCHGIIQGYPCGGIGEPCDPQHRPYFRQGNSATRGQISKIVYLSLSNPPVSCTP